MINSSSKIISNMGGIITQTFWKKRIKGTFLTYFYEKRSEKFHVTVIKNCSDHGTGLSGIPLSVRACFSISDRVWVAVLNPLLEKINRRWKIKRGILRCIAGAARVCGGWWIAQYGIGYALISQAKKLVQNYDSVAAQGTQVWNLCCQRVEELCGIQNGYVEHCVSSYVPMLWQKCRTDVVPKLMNYSIGYVKGFLVGFTIFIVIMVSTILILADYPNIRKKAVDHPIGNLIYRIGRNMKKAGGTYLKAQLIILLIISSICCVGLFLTGNSYAVLVGCGIGLCDALPFFGTGTVFIPWLLFKVFCGQYLLAGAYGIIYLI